MDYKQNEEIIYPEETPTIISKLMVKHGLLESEDDFIEKLIRGETAMGEIIAGIIRLVAEEEIQIKDLATNLSEALNISKVTSVDLAEDIKKEIIAFINKKPITESNTQEKIETQEKNISSKSENKDAYREPVE